MHGRREVMVSQVSQIFMVLVEVVYEICLASPHVDVMGRIAEMVSQATPKVSCTKYENL